MKVSLTVWAQLHYDPPPSIRTLRAWAATGQLHPEPELVGRCYMVEKTAVRVHLPPAAANDSTMSDRAKAILLSA